MFSQILLALLSNKLTQTFWRLLIVEALPAHVQETPLAPRFRFPADNARLAFSSPTRIAEQLAATVMMHDHNKYSLTRQMVGYIGVIFSIDSTDDSTDAASTPGRNISSDLRAV